ncbi:reverse transcriptase domain-containing protein [Tanacetum coccineum]
MKFPNVPSTSVKLMLFPFSLEGAAQIWLEKEPPRSILTWDDLVSKFINKFFPPSKTTNLRNKITRFQQKFDETFYEAWDRFNDLLRGCPHHGFSELHQLDTFYNALNSNHQDSLNSAAGGNFLDKMLRECLKIIESKSKVRQSQSKAVIAKVSTSSSTPAVSSDVAELKDMVRALILDKKNQTPAPSPFKRLVQAYVNLQDKFTNPRLINPRLFKLHLTKLPLLSSSSNTTSTSGLGSLPSNTIANPKGDVKAITTRSGVSYNGPQIFSSFLKRWKMNPRVTKDTVQQALKTSTSVVSTDTKLVSIVASRPKPTLPYLQGQQRELREKDDLLASKFMEIFWNLHRANF